MEEVREEDRGEDLRHNNPSVGSAGPKAGVEDGAAGEKTQSFAGGGSFRAPVALTLAPGDKQRPGPCTGDQGMLLKGSAPKGPCHRVTGALHGESQRRRLRKGGH